MPRAAPQSPTSERSAAGSPGAGAPSASPAPGCLNATLALLKADLEAHEKAADELRGLVAGLAAYTTSGLAKPVAAPPLASPPPPEPPPARRRPGRVPMSDEERKAKGREKQRRRRDRIRAAADSKKNTGDAAAVDPEPEPEPADEERLKEIASIMETIVTFRAEAAKFFGHDRRGHRLELDKIARLRRRGGFLLRELKRGTELPLSRDEAKAWRAAAYGTDESFEEHLAHLSPPVQQLSDWTEDENGTLTRTKTAVAAADAAPV
jgi:hypothetical protein